MKRISLTLPFFQPLVLLSLVSLLIVASSCEKWEILYDCDINEVPGSLFPGTPEGKLNFSDDGRLAITNRYAIGTNPMDMSRTKVLDGSIGPRWATQSHEENAKISDWYAIWMSYEGIDYSIKDGDLFFTSKTIPVTVSFLHFTNQGQEEVQEMKGKLRIVGSAHVGGDRYLLAQLDKLESDVTLYLRLKNGQRLRFRLKTLEDPNFSVHVKPYSLVKAVN